MSSSTRYRDMLNLWASDFMFHFHPEANSRYGSVAENLVFGDDLQPVMANDPNQEEVKRPVTPIFGYALGRVAKWNVPITVNALKLVLVGCANAAHVDMVLAVLYKTYIGLANKGNDKIDATFVREVLHEGLISEVLFSEMWEKQRIKELGQNPVHNLLDLVTAKDFQ